MVISLLVCWIIGVGMLSKYIFVNEKLREIIILIVKLYKLKEKYIYINIYSLYRRTFL